ncbi:MAG: ABC transporter permease [Opitutaceae bacterium]
MRILCYELLLAWRRWYRRPTQTVLLTVTFALSITLAVVSWSLFHTVFLKNAEFDPEGTLLLVSQGGPKAPRRYVGYGKHPAATREDVRAWESAQTVFSDFAVVGLYRTTFLTAPEGSERLLAAHLSTVALRLLGAQPLLGRLFVAGEDELGSAPAALLSELLWRNRYGADPGMVGRILNLDGRPVTVVGVLPASFRFPNDQMLWLSLGSDVFETNPQIPIHDVIGRLKPGVTRQRAEEELRQITARRGAQTFAATHELRPILTPLRDYYLDDALHQSAWVLGALSLIFVLVSCANAANLTMIDFFGRSAEVATLLALGLPRRAVLLGLSIQMVWTALIAGALASVALVGLGPLVHRALVLTNMPYWLPFTYAWHHVAVAFALAALSAFLALILPALHLTLNRSDRLAQAAAGAQRGSGRNRGRHLLLAGQVALLTMLAVCAGLLVRSQRHVAAEHWGFDARLVYVGKTGAAFSSLPDTAARRLSHDRILEGLLALPGVKAAALLSHAIGYSGAPSLWYARSPELLQDQRSEGGAFFAATTPGIFEALEVPLVEGKTVTEKIGAPDQPAEAVVNASLASRLWPGQSAIGRILHARYGTSKELWSVRIVGVARDFQASGPKATNNDFIFCNYAGWFPISGFLYARGTTVPPSVTEVTEVVRRADPRVSSYFGTTLQEVIDRELGSVRLTARLTVVYALAAMVLCAIGVYSVTVSSLLQRSREFGIRLALGIDAVRLWRRFARTHLLLAAAGVLVGMVGAALVAPVLRASLYGVPTRDPMTYLVAAMLILGVAGAACLPSLPRLRRISPAECLRSL